MFTHKNYEGGRSGRERPAKAGGGRREAAEDREESPPLHAGGVLRDLFSDEWAWRSP